ncbi:alpha/beta hydrolase [Acidovorax radicis]|uniref:alpha/beta hydrolase n=1 Tax=Acidovorax radicis TaxID=758826 RepID=UPI000237752F|nr:alpha/beta hydrolase-fold protein [Acidovorax radicis]
MPVPLSPQGTRRALLAAGAGASLGLLGGCAHGKATAPPLLQAAPAQLPGTHQQDLRDPASGRTWRIWVQQPAGPAPATGYPVLYLLDGNAAFALAAQLARNSAGRPGDMGTDSTIVVGIGHPGDAVIHPAERQRDYTPPVPGSTATPEAGGADILLDFIARELQPRVAHAFATDPQRQTLSGHSFGGLLVLHALFTRPAQFTRYAATSPSVWWNGAQLLRTAGQFAQVHAMAPRPFRAQLLLRVGSLEQAQTAPTAARAAIQVERRMVERTLALADQLGALQWPELRVDMAMLPGLDHGSAMAPGLIDALALAQQPR